MPAFSPFFPKNQLILTRTNTVRYNSCDLDNNNWMLAAVHYALAAKSTLFWPLPLHCTLHTDLYSVVNENLYIMSNESMCLCHKVTTVTTHILLLCICHIMGLKPIWNHFWNFYRPTISRDFSRFFFSFRSTRFSVSGEQS